MKGVGHRMLLSWRPLWYYSADAYFTSTEQLRRGEGRGVQEETEYRDAELVSEDANARARHWEQVIICLKRGQTNYSARYIH